MKVFLMLTVLITGAILSAPTWAFFGLCNKTDSSKVYTLYRSSALYQDMRIHVASFDVDDNAAYNNENCLDAAKLRKSQKGVIAKFWCEKGYYKK